MRCLGTYGPGSSFWLSFLPWNAFNWHNLAWRLLFLPLVCRWEEIRLQQWVSDKFLRWHVLEWIHAEAFEKYILHNSYYTINLLLQHPSIRNRLPFGNSSSHQFGSPDWLLWRNAILKLPLEIQGVVICKWRAFLVDKRLCRSVWVRNSWLLCGWWN